MKQQISSIFTCGFLVTACVLISACADSIGVKRIGIRERYTHFTESALNHNRPSDFTQRYLHQNNLLAVWQKHPPEAIKRINAMTYTTPDRDTLFVLAELTYLEAHQYDVLSKEAADLYLSSAVYAFQFLFDPQAGDLPDRLNARTRLACNLYNRSLAGFLGYVREHRDTMDQVSEFELVNGKLILESAESDLPWDPKEYDDFICAYEFLVKGLPEHHKTEGLGVPVIAVHSPHPLKQKREEEKFLPQFKMMYPVTVFLTITEPPGNHYGSNVVYRGHIQMHHSADTETVRIGDEDITLEADYTTPLAYTVEGMPYYSGLGALLDVADNEKFEGLYMFEPYDNKKIPLLFVHGLMSEPKTWIPMINTLIGDPELRKRYQVWFYLYPTGNPILLSAASLRDALDTVRNTYHFDEQDAAFDKMVIVGHSMGGIMTKLMLVHSSNCFWDAVMDISLEQSGLTDEEKKFFRRLFFFEPFEQISRAIFISSPLLGAPMADKFYSRVGSSLIHLPEGYSDLMKDAFKRMDEAHKRHNQRFNVKEMHTGIDSLSPGNVMLKILGSRPIPANVTYHSIIGDNTAADKIGGSDGVVPYWSSHQEGAASEKVILSEHNAQKQSAGILEVKRILHEHLKQ